MTGIVNALKFFEAPDVTLSSEGSEMIAADEKLSRAELIMKTDKHRESEKSKAKVLYLAVGLGQEHRLGRWWKVKGAKNQVRIIKLA